MPNRFMGSSRFTAGQVSRLTAMLLLFLATPAIREVIFGSQPDPLAVTGLLVAFALYLATVALASISGKPARRGPAVGTLIALGVLTFGLALRYGHPMFSLFPLLALACGFAVPRRDGPWNPLVIGVLILPAVVLGGWPAWNLTGDGLAIWYQTLFGGVAAATYLRLQNTIQELRATREELALTAVANERLRFSRDLHDLLGHTLSVIVVKAEAVQRLAEQNPKVVAEQAGDIQTIGRQALKEVREAVTGYRQRSVTEEITQARNTLDDAGILVKIQLVGDFPLPATAETALGWVMREGVTNVIRHSQATKCKIVLTNHGDRATLCIQDNGVGSNSEQGNGLRGLADRLATEGGNLTTFSDKGFRLLAELPFTEPS